MKQNYLLPHRYKKIGWILLVPAVILGCYVLFNDNEPKFFHIRVLSFFEKDKLGFHWIKFRYNNVFNEIVMILLLVSLWFVAFSKEKIEDEYIKKIRLESLVWATHFNLFILLFSVLFLYDLNFFFVMELNLFSLLIFFVVRFNLELRKLKKTATNEE